MAQGASPREIYADRLAERTRGLTALERRRSRIGTLRLLVFLVLAALLWAAFHGDSLWWTAAPVALSSSRSSGGNPVSSVMPNASAALSAFTNAASPAWNIAGRERESGDRFLDPHHPYSIDLDIFGRASLFELLSTARTRGGEARLAAWLQAASSTEELRARHEAVDELRPLLDLREQIARPRRFPRRRSSRTIGAVGK